MSLKAPRDYHINSEGLTPFFELLKFIYICVNSEETGDANFIVDGIKYDVSISTSPGVGTNQFDINSTSLDIFECLHNLLACVERTGKVSLRLGSTDRHKKYITITTVQDVSLIRQSFKDLAISQLQ